MNDLQPVVREGQLRAGLFFRRNQGPRRMVNRIKALWREFIAIFVEALVEDEAPA